MQEILTVKELITKLEGGEVSVGDKVCVVGNVSYKDFGTRKLIYTIEGQNSHISCYDSKKGNKVIVKLNKSIYVEGEVDKRLGEYSIKNITKVDNKVLKQRLLRVYETEKTDQNKLYLLMADGDEKNAIKLLESSENINVNGSLNHTKLIYFAIECKMPKLFDAILNHSDFSTEGTNDPFEETLLTCLLYLYSSDTIKGEYKKLVRDCINSVISCGKFDLNETNLNNETALIVSCQSKELNWVTSILCANKDVYLNVCDDYDATAIEHAIREENYEAVNMLLKRDDLNLTDSIQEAVESMKKVCVETVRE